MKGKYIEEALHAGLSGFGGCAILFAAYLGAARHTAPGLDWESQLSYEIHQLRCSHIKGVVRTDFKSGSEIFLSVTRGSFTPCGPRGLGPLNERPRIGAGEFLAERFTPAP